MAPPLLPRSLLPLPAAALRATPRYTSLVQSKAVRALSELTSLTHHTMRPVAQQQWPQCRLNVSVGHGGPRRVCAGRICTHPPGLRRYAIALAPRPRQQSGYYRKRASPVNHRLLQRQVPLPALPSKQTPFLLHLLFMFSVVGPPDGPLAERSEPAWVCSTPGQGTPAKRRGQATQRVRGDKRGSRGRPKRNPKRGHRVHKNALSLSRSTTPQARK